ncbi:MAG TPA: transglutaminase family protein [Candidatus Methylacidiphilales bacterium]|nr:transglutaminase family protein [Candidatus Methylacidiphilales bacterium]
MSIHAALSHVTHYRYAKPVTLGPQVVRLRPAPHCRTPILNYNFKVTPKEHFLNWQQDPQGNFQARLVFLKKTSEFKVEVELTAEMAALNPFDFFLEDAAKEFPFTYDAILGHELKPYLELEPLGPGLRTLLSRIPRSKRNTIDFLVDLNGLIKNEVQYVVRLEPGVQTVEETLKLKSGSCRDSAYLLVQTARQLGLAARFVSGYLIQLTADQKPVDGGAAGPEADFTDLHAWTEVYLPGAGWVGLDPTSGLLAGEGHIPLAATSDPETAAPIDGTLSSEEEDEIETKFDFHMSVTRVLETPRVTLPYRDHQWREIEALGGLIDEKLAAQDVRLTMGGEPTFVSTTNRDGLEWNFTALSPEKQAKGDALLKRLRDRFATGALLHYGQGKWYPGEQLPRWAYGCFWRKDGQPIWNNYNLVAETGKNYKVTPEDSARFLHKLAERLELDTRYVRDAYEDIYHYIFEEGRLPYNVSAFDSKIKSEEDRKRLARVFAQGLDAVVGHTLPVIRANWLPGQPWKSTIWQLRTDRMMLIPGDSPMGYRLPLESLPWATRSEAVQIVEQDPTERRQPLPPASQRSIRRSSSRPFDGPRPGEDPWDYQRVPQGVPDVNVVRTSICAEPRNGILHVFMPPTQTAEDYLDLTAAVEDIAEDMNLPVRIEGYTPPHDPRITHFKITPDPGVIEVNLQPANNFPELQRNTEVLYEEARHVDLTAEKFLLDGRHVGTGGGNHIVLGGATVLDSPLLRRPDLLKSLIGYWQNHPSLSYLFSGIFLGPTSQMPRVDEARNDVLYELELAFNQVPDFSQAPPWLVDRIFRHILTDSTGNTHRAEFCIDKLFDPGSSAGRHGLLELRSFEMPPHARMSLVQQLLLRGAVAKFWEKPYKGQPVAWGTQLHDRFLLPHFCNQDFNDVINDFNLAGLPFKTEWFAPHMEFRFPLQGEVTYDGVHMELRTALEPWHVLGEEGTPGGTVRYVDSSVEKLQVKIDNAIEGRHLVTCNGRRVPMHPTGTPGEYVAGVRYRAWQPAEALHPTISVDAPLTFDVLDTWTGRSLGGCQYFVSSPGGRNWTTMPINANEAEGRKLSRYRSFGHTPGSMFVPPPAPAREDFPLTLDLRKR